MKNFKLPKPLTAIAYIVAFIAIQTVSQAIVLVTEMAIKGDDTIKLGGVDLLIATCCFSVNTIALFGWLKWAPLKRTFIQSRPVTTLLWCFVASLGAIIPSVYFQEQMPEWSDSIQQYIEQTGQTMLQMMNAPGGYAVICLLVPIAEEMVCRGAALRKLL